VCPARVQERNFLIRSERKGKKQEKDNKGVDTGKVRTFMFWIMTPIPHPSSL
jgi:hypothetical protein